MSTPVKAKPRLIDKIVGPSPTEREALAELDKINQAMEWISNRHESLLINLGEEGYTFTEALQNIDLMLDAQGWTSMWDYEADSGLTLRQVKEASKQIRELIVGNPFIGNGARIRGGQTWGGGVDFSTLLRTGPNAGQRRPLPVEYQRIMDSYWGQRYIFGNKAHSELERAAYSDGVCFFLGRNGDKQTQRIQLQEITGLLHNPNNSEEVWAYRRQWNADPENPNQTSSMRVRWYYTDAVPASERRRRVKIRGGETEVAEPEYTLIDSHFNRQVGWSLGVPDALCVIAWARLYKEFLVNGYVMSRSLARLAYKITVATATGGQNSAVTVATPGQSGSTYVEGAGNSLTPLATAGKGYDFGSGAGLGSAIAAGLGVSWLALTANPASATGNAAQTLDPIAKATAAVRRREWDDEFVRIFRFFGLDRKVVTTWHDLPEDTVARVLQAWRLAEQMEIFEGEVLHAGVAEALQIGDPKGLPSGWKQPSERKSATEGTFGQDGQSPANGRGTDDGSGQSPDDHDDDTT